MRVEGAFQKRQNTYTVLLEDKFHPRHFDNNAIKAELARRVFRALFDRHYKGAVQKFERMPVVYRQAADSDAHSNPCSDPSRLKNVGDMGIANHQKMWVDVMKSADMVVDETRKAYFPGE